MPKKLEFPRRTVATNPTLIFTIIRDPPGGLSTATLVEGSVISTSMAIDGSHAAELEDHWQFGGSVGVAADVRGGVCLGGMVSKNVWQMGGTAGVTYSETHPDITISRASSRHFDVNTGARPLYLLARSVPRALTQGQQLTGHDFMGLPPTTGYEVGNFKGCPDCGWLSVPQPASPELVKHTSFPQLRKTGQPQT